jgi:hypothetical protein
MAQVTQSVAAVHGMRPYLIPAPTLAKLSQSELVARLDHVADLSARAERASNPVIADCYRSVAKAALTALPPAELTQLLHDKRAKAARLGPSMGDDLLRQADELEARNPMPPKASVRKAQGEPSLTPCYDRNGNLIGVVDESAVTPISDSDVIAKAAGAGMAGVFSDQGKAVGFAHKDAVAPVTRHLGTPDSKALDAFAAAHGVSAADLAGWLGQRASGTAQPAAVAKVAVYDYMGHLAGRVDRSKIMQQVTKADAEKVTLAPVFDQDGRLVGVCDPDAITPVSADGAKVIKAMGHAAVAARRAANTPVAKATAAARPSSILRAALPPAKRRR